MISESAVSEDGEYEERLAALVDELARTRSDKEELSKEVGASREENEVLVHTSEQPYTLLVTPRMKRNNYLITC